MRSDTIRRKVVVAALAVGVALAGTAVPAGRAVQASELAQGGHGSGPRAGNGAPIHVQSSGSGTNLGGGGHGHTPPGGNASGPGTAVGNQAGQGATHGNAQGLRFSGPTTLQVYQHASHYVQHVPTAYHVYHGPFFHYDYEWYFYRHLSFPWLYVVYVEEPVLVCTTEYYFYDGLFYCFVGEL
ncbi:MAG TPA: hypothetical protein VKZ60_15590 [Chloroflexota bacterium]|jgi:hypothetical protein|nr:hypothetical protein [Chloroflexota bacterium]